MGSENMKLLGVSLLIGIALGAPQGSQKDLETVPYTVVATHQSGDQSFEERHYAGGIKWVCTKSTIIDVTDNDNGMFNKLFNYITGSNSENINIDMTTPVSTKWQNGEVTDGSLIEHEMCFYLNKDHQKNPPKPSSPDVYIVTRPEMTIYTREISHRMSEQDWIKESSALDQMIKSLGFEVDENKLYVNGYSDPWAIKQRNELWKVKKTSQNVKENLETVPYTVVATHHVGENSFEERNYEVGLKWVCTKSDSDNGMFMKLFDYISGSNSENENIDMTTPVSTKWLRIDENTVEHEECFFLNKEHQNDPPEPSASDVYIVSRPAMTIYTRILTRNFWHHMTEAEWIKESNALDQMIDSMGFQVKSDEIYINGYSGPMSFKQRSELWKVKETSQTPKESLESVPYTVVAIHHVGKNSFEERNYEGGLKWVCTKSDSGNGMFQKLFAYISGSNSNNENIDMTTPVSTEWHQIDENTGNWDEECFFLNKEHQSNPPEPTASDVYIVSRPAMTIYTRILTKNFWHHMTEAEWIKESNALDQMIDSMGFQVKSDEIYINGYSSPWAFRQRSELWKVKEM